jgi:hypothetical protein
MECQDSRLRGIKEQLLNDEGEERRKDMGEMRELELPLKLICGR